MGKFRGFRLKKHFIGLTLWILHRSRRSCRPVTTAWITTRRSPRGRSRPSYHGAAASPARHAPSTPPPRGVDPDRDKPPRPKGLPRGVRRTERHRLPARTGAGDLLQPPAVREAAEGRGRGVWIQPVKRAHHPLRRLRLRARSGVSNFSIH
ncbi:hypothetical protein SAY87_011166 [Trapa incisa]|uniref:Uncharacterized protein n=1 Tax=Trapa incisa TaxID=236973 RepID=A0AAN7GVU9_9MYRT|nr:hypothetical protein SAY87_011166 [Trapa incisa]